MLCTARGKLPYKSDGGDRRNLLGVKFHDLVIPVPFLEDMNRLVVIIGTSLIGVRMNTRHVHKTRFWYLLGVLIKMTDDPREIYRSEDCDVWPLLLYSWFSRDVIKF